MILPSSFVRQCVVNKTNKNCDFGLKLYQESRLRCNFLPIVLYDNFRPEEVAGDVIYCVAAETVGLDGYVKFGDSETNCS